MHQNHTAQASSSWAVLLMIPSVPRIPHTETKQAYLLQVKCVDECNKIVRPTLACRSGSPNQILRERLNLWHDTCGGDIGGYVREHLHKGRIIICLDLGAM